MTLCHDIKPSVHSKWLMYLSTELSENGVLKNCQGVNNNPRLKMILTVNIWFIFHYIAIK